MRNFLNVTLSITTFFLLFALFFSPAVTFLHPGPGDLEPNVQLLLEGIAAVAALFAAIVAGIIFKRPRARDFGLIMPSGLALATIGTLIGGVLVAIVVAVLFASDAVVPNDETSFPTGAVLMTVLLGLFFNTIFQNVAFRGYILGAVAAKYGVFVGVIVSSLLFVGVHAGVFAEPWPINMIGALNLFLAGLLLSIAYLRTGSLWLPIGIHFGWNGTWTALGLSVSKASFLARPSLFQLSGHSLVTGGGVGPEGGLPGLLGPLAGILLVSLFFRRRNWMVNE